MVLKVRHSEWEVATQGWHTSAAAMSSPPRHYPHQDLDALATRLLADLRSLDGLRRHHLLCRLAHTQFSDIGSRHLHAIADQLNSDRRPDRAVVDMLRFLAELDAIDTVGVHGAAMSSDKRMRSETALHFGQATSVLRQAVRACLRQHRW